VAGGGVKERYWSIRETEWLDKLPLKGRLTLDRWSGWGAASRSAP